jgi:hypothetical protein
VEGGGGGGRRGSHARGNLEKDANGRPRLNNGPSAIGVKRPLPLAAVQTASSSVPCGTYHTAARFGVLIRGGAELPRLGLVPVARKGARTRRGRYTI